MSATVGSLCTGYGGLDMGLALALGGLRHAWHVEYAAAPAAILRHHYPEVPNHGDLTTLDHGALEPVDWLTAGYPCQPFSDAGRRLGEADARHLWPYVADAIGHLRPRNVLLENVRGHLRRGFDSVLADLAALGYDASWGVVRASAAGAPHRRERIFVVATDASHHGHERPRETWHGRPGPTDSDLPATDPDGARLEGGEQPHRSDARRSAAAPVGLDTAGCSDVARWGRFAPAIARWESIFDRPAPAPTEPRGRGGAHRLSPRFVEWMMGLPDGWVTAVPGLTARDHLVALGNGVVPRQAALAVTLLLRQRVFAEQAA